MFDMLCVDTFYLFICQTRTCAPLVLSLQNVGTNNSLTPSQTFPSSAWSDERATDGLESLQSISGQIISVTLIWQSK